VILRLCGLRKSKGPLSITGVFTNLVPNKMPSRRIEKAYKFYENKAFIKLLDAPYSVRFGQQVRTERGDALPLVFFGLGQMTGFYRR
jgi:hypothetical protein